MSSETELGELKDSNDPEGEAPAAKDGEKDGEKDNKKKTEEKAADKTFPADLVNKVESLAGVS